MRSTVANQRGSAILVTLALVVMFSGIGILAVNRAQTDTDLAFNQVHHDQAFWLAEAGAERGIAQIQDSMEWRGGYTKEPLGNGHYSVSVTDSSTDAALGVRVRMIALGQQGEAASGIEVIMGPEEYHPLFDHAMYAGNRDEYDSTVDTQTYTAVMEFGGCGADADVINGDVFHNGHIQSNCDSDINGSAEAGATITGNAPSGGATENADYLAPPDLQAENYETTADFVINSTSPWDAGGNIASSDPRHIFVKEFRPDLATDVGFTFDNTNYFFGDPWEGVDLNLVSVSSAGNNKTYFIDGNLWIEPYTTISRLIKSPPEGTQITIVAKGNIYIADELLYDNQAKDGIALIAMTDGESYDDLNGDNQYNLGEPLLRDDGDGIYEGPIEGSGNVYFGDPNGGPLGHVHAYIYADNNFEDHALDPAGTPLDFQITGTMSAGNEIKINRDFLGGHAEMTVTYDERLKNGDISLPGLPRRSNVAKRLIVLSWREL